MIHLLGIGLAIAGFLGLGLAMDRHGADLLGRRLNRASCRISRIAAACLLLLSLWTALAQTSTGIAIILWLGYLTLGAMLATGMFSLTASRLWHAKSQSRRH